MSMISRPFIILGFMALAGCGYTAPLDIASLPDLQGLKFKSTPYIRAAAALQDIGQDAACQALLQVAETNRADRQIIVLCRMLFVARGTNEFRRPLIGMPHCLGGTDYSVWTLEPIELVDGIPFVITEGYSLGGVAESAKSYLRYCMTNCDWSGIRFREPTERQKRDALAKLAAPGKWKHPLSAPETEFLSTQIE